MKKTILIFVIVLIIVGVGAFYGGMKYRQSKAPPRRVFQELSPEQRQQFFQGRAGRISENFLLGEIISKDNQSLTLKLPDGSSRIIFFSSSTQISKTTEGSINDIEIGKQIMVSGSQNSDGSFTAKIIQLSPRYLAPEK
jgi:hypothetical protein